MEKRITKELIDEFIEKNEKYNFKKETMKSLLDGGHDYSFTKQRAYEDPDCLNVNIRNSIRSVEGNPGYKDTAIKIYKKLPI